VLLLLAMVTGYPVEAAEVIRELLERLNPPHCPDSWWRLLEMTRDTHEPGRRQAAPAKRPMPSTRAVTEKSRVDLDSNDEFLNGTSCFRGLTMRRSSSATTTTRRRRWADGHLSSSRDIRSRPVDC